MTPLHYAARAGHLAFVQWAVELLATRPRAKADDWLLLMEGESRASTTSPGSSPTLVRHQPWLLWGIPYQSSHPIYPLLVMKGAAGGDEVEPLRRGGMGVRTPKTRMLVSL